MRTANCFLVAALLCLAGCQDRFVDERTITFEKNADLRTLIVPASTAERTLHVSVHVFLEENQEEAERMITLQKRSDLVLAEAEDTTKVNLKAKLPPNKTACVMIHAGNDATKVELMMND
jgi:hypothetical protein